MKLIDLRSDTVTRPSSDMRKAMCQAEVGDDVYSEDPTTNDLQEFVADMTGMEDALFLPSGTQSNLVAILSHCQRGDEYITGQQYHCYRYEGGGAAVFGGVQPQPIQVNRDGTLDLNEISNAIKPQNDHFAKTRLLCLENTTAGRVLSLAYQKEATGLAKKYHLKRHLDGARIFNAITKLGVSLSHVTQYYDSVSICLSKGLGAPAGTVLAGNQAFIQKARRWRKMAGGGMRQSGILAAAGLYALRNNPQRLLEDHENALLLARGLAEFNDVVIDWSTVQTNMVFVNLASGRESELVRFLEKKGILVGGYGVVRFVTHLDISASDIQAVIEAFRMFYRQH